MKETDMHFDHAYFVSAGIAGYVATNTYRKLGGENWVWNINLTSCLFASRCLELSMTCTLSVSYLGRL